MAIIDAFYEELGAYLVYRVRQEIKTPRSRYSKSPRRMKRGSPYNFYATGNLWRSVEARADADMGEILILMEDYGVNNVFNPDPDLGGSWPGGGAFYPDRRPKNQKQKFSNLIEELTKWAKAKFNMDETRAKGMAFAVRKNLFKAGFAGMPLFTEDLLNDVRNHADKLLEKPEYAEDILPDEIQKAIDGIFALGNQTYDISIL
jgi:hypothetical protein